MFECSPYMNPWIKRDARSNATRIERLRNVPMCTKDCDEWFNVCKDDYTCSDNWGDPKTWKWTKQGNMCRMPFKTFKEYYGGPENFVTNFLTIRGNTLKAKLAKVARPCGRMALSTSTGKLRRSMLGSC